MDRGRRTGIPGAPRLSVMFSASVTNRLLVVHQQVDLAVA